MWRSVGNMQRYSKEFRYVTVYGGKLFEMYYIYAKIVCDVIYWCYIGRIIKCLLLNLVYNHLSFIYKNIQNTSVTLMYMKNNC